MDFNNINNNNFNVEIKNGKTESSSENPKEIDKRIETLIATHSELINFGREHPPLDMKVENLSEKLAKMGLSEGKEPVSTMDSNANALESKSSISKQKSFEDGIFDWMKDLNVRGNKQEAAKRILDCYKNSSNSLNLSLLELSSIPPEIGNLSNLIKLYLRDNQLTELPPKIGNLSNLKGLGLENNQLTKFPPEIGNLRNLTGLGLEDNQLTELPLEIGNLSNLSILVLEGNQLTRLPPEIGNLSNLKKLYLGKNKLTGLPPEIENLINLTELYLGENQLTELPPKIGNLCNLKKLYLHKNQLKELSSKIGNLSNLRVLDLVCNQLIELPVEMGQLRSLELLDTINNTNLSQLPLCLGNLVNLTYVGTYGTQILNSERVSILDSCKKLRKTQAIDALPDKIKVWVNTSKKGFDLSEIDQLDIEQKGHLYEWLIRLERTKDFQKDQQALAVIVCEILKEMLTNEEFKGLFFSQVEVNNKCCQDRASMALNEIYVSMLLLSNQKAKTLQERLQLLVGCAKTLALRNAVSQVINDHQQKQGYVEGEGVQIYLYCETHLRDILGLVTAIKSMTYTAIGKRDWVDQEKLIKMVNSTYLDFLLEIPALEELLKKEKDYQEMESKQMDEIDKEILVLCKKEPQTKNKLSDEYLDWEKKVKVLNTQRKEKVKEIRKEWMKGKLSL